MVRPGPDRSALLAPPQPFTFGFGPVAQPPDGGAASILPSAVRRFDGTYPPAVLAGRPWVVVAIVATLALRAWLSVLLALILATAGGLGAAWPDVAILGVTGPRLAVFGLGGGIALTMLSAVDVVLAWVIWHSHKLDGIGGLDGRDRGTLLLAVP